MKFFKKKQDPAQPKLSREEAEKARWDFIEKLAREQYEEQAKRSPKKRSFQDLSDEEFDEIVARGLRKAAEEAEKPQPKNFDLAPGEGFEEPEEVPESVIREYVWRYLKAKDQSEDKP